MKRTISLLPLALSLVTVGCGRVRPEQWGQVRDELATAQVAVGTMAVQGQNALATAQVLGATAVVQGRTGAATAQVLGATAVVEARLLATRMSEGGESAWATVQAWGTPTVSLKQRLAGLIPNDDGGIQLYITEAELTSALTWDRPNDDGRLQNLHATIRDGNINLIGEVTSPVQATATIVFQPYLQAGSLQMKVVAGSLGNIPLPQAVLQSAENRINSALLTAIKLIPGQAQWTDVTATNGTLTLLGYTTR